MCHVKNVIYTYRYQHKVDRKCRGEEGLNSRERTQKKLDQFGQFGFSNQVKREEWKSLRKKRAI